jgi:branched-subunit amino acid ABC-type transport system permease component
VVEQVAQILASSLSQGGVYALLGLGFSMAGMATRILNLAQGGYALLGGFLFLTLIERLHLPLALAVPLALVAAGLLGVLTEKIVNLRSRPWSPVSHDMAVLSTLALLVAAEGLASLLWGTDPVRGVPMQAGTFRLFGAVIGWQFLWMLATTVLVALGLHLLLSRTWIGRAMRACAQNTLMAHLLGINVRTLSALTFALGGVIGALGGILASPITWLDYQLGGFFMLYGLLAYLIGGEDEVLGPLVGGMLLAFVQNIVLLLPGITGGLLKQVLPMAALLLMLVFRPSGLLPRRRAA